MCKNLFAFPVSRKDDFFPVRAYMIVFCRYLRGIVFELASPGISYVDIDRVTVAVQLPNTGNLKIIPTFVVEISLVKVGRACVCVSHPVEFPKTVQGHEICGIFFNAGFSFISRCESKVISVHSGAVCGIHFRIFPLVEALRLNCCQSQCSQAARE